MLSRTLVLAILLLQVRSLPALEPVSVGVWMTFERAPAKGFVSAVEHELGAIMRDACCRLHWIIGAGKGETWDHAFIVRFRGSCVAASTPDASRGAEPDRPITLAQSAYQDHSILPYADLDCDRLRDFLNTPGEARLGRATGRLLAHELYHVLLQTREHGKKGIAKAVQTPAELLSRSLRFQSEDLERFRSVK